MKAPRGIRNNNPGNIRKSGSKWQGMSPEQTDSEFVQFTSAIYGIRALYVLIRNYQRRYNCSSVRKIINRWAPPVENDTGAYVKAVAEACGVLPDATIDIVKDKFLAERLICAIIKHENGRQPYSHFDVSRAIDLAGS